MQSLSNAEAITQKTYVDINTISGPIVPSYNCNITFKLNVCQLLKCLELISQSFWSISFKLFPDRKAPAAPTPAHSTYSSSWNTLWSRRATEISLTVIHIDAVSRGPVVPPPPFPTPGQKPQIRQFQIDYFTPSLLSLLSLARAGQEITQLTITDTTGTAELGLGQHWNLCSPILTIKAQSKDP